MKRYKSKFNLKPIRGKLSERYGDLDKEVDRWYDDLVKISELHFEKKVHQPELEHALRIAKTFAPYAAQGTKSSTFQEFRKEVMKLRDKHFKRLQMFLKKLKPGDYDMEGVAQQYGYKSYKEYEDACDYGEIDEIPEIDSKEFKYWSNDKGGNASVVNSIIDLYAQGIQYHGDLDEYYETI